MDSHVAVTFAVVVALFTLVSVPMPVTVIRIAAGAIFFFHPSGPGGVGFLFASQPPSHQHSVRIAMVLPPLGRGRCATVIVGSFTDSASQRIIINVAQQFSITFGTNHVPLIARFTIHHDNLLSTSWSAHPSGPALVVTAGRLVPEDARAYIGLGHISSNPIAAIPRPGVDCGLDMHPSAIACSLWGFLHHLLEDVCNVLRLLLRP